ncbi:MAG: hypothetical protein R8P61_21320 [Bacteroidia bacterium]|nr:hypothetical protein [Bacteroidia bacterium]
MSLSPNLKTTLLYVASLCVFSLFLFAILQGWYATRNVDQFEQTEKNLTQEISDLEISLAELEQNLLMKNQQLIMRDQLLEEKNIELDYLNHEVSKWKSLYFRQKKANPEASNPVIVNASIKENQASSLSSFKMR